MGSGDDGGESAGVSGYEEKVRALQERTGLTEAVVTGKGRINGMETVIGVCDGRFMMASMGEAGWGEDYAGGGEGDEALAAGDFVCVLGRGADAGGDCFSDADGEDVGGAEKTQ